MSPDAEIRPAATVVLLRDGSGAPEVFMVRRHHAVAFMAGAYVFPGGRVDAADADADAAWCDGIAEAQQQLEPVAHAERLGYFVAAARELFEEAGVLLARDRSGALVAPAAASDRGRFDAYRSQVHQGAITMRQLAEREGLRLALDSLVAFARWVTPPFDIRRFDTWFFAARLPAQQSAAHDDTEATESRWITPHGGIEAALRREILLPPPTWTTMTELEPHASVDEALRWAARRSVHRREPMRIEENGTRVIVIPDETGTGVERRFRWDNDRFMPEGRA